MFRTRFSLCLALAAATLTLGPARSAPDSTDVEVRKDVQYLADREEKLDLYLPTGRAADVRSPAVLIIHGGGWRAGDKGAAREINIGTTLARAGYVCASVNYRMTGPEIWPGNLQDCKNGVRYLRKHAAELQVDPARVGVIGGSAGGHLALMVGFTASEPEFTPAEPYPGVSDRVDAVVDMYGIADPRTWQTTDAEGNPTGTFKPGGSAFLGGKLEEAPERWKLAAPVEHIRKDSPPVLILHGTRDTTVDRDQSSTLAKKLKETGVPHQLLLIEGVGHTFDLQTWNRKPLPYDLRPVVIRFLDQHLKRPEKPKSRTPSLAVPVGKMLSNGCRPERAAP